MQGLAEVLRQAIDNIQDFQYDQSYFAILGDWINNTHAMQFLHPFIPCCVRPGGQSGASINLSLTEATSKMNLIGL